MRLSHKLVVCLLIFCCTYTSGQINEYSYKRELTPVFEQWHKIILPNEVYRHLAPTPSNIRIYGIKANADTIEVPYLLREKNEQVSTSEIAFKLLNVAHNQVGYYFTFEIPSVEAINQIKLQFKQQNFDWRIHLQGSQNQQEWFSVLEDYRILSVTNDYTNFQFTTLAFPPCNYKYFRLRIKSKEKPGLTKASVLQQVVKQGEVRNYSIRRSAATENKQSKRTDIDIELEMPVMVSKIKLDVLDTFDYYRPITIKYLSDSIKLEQGWKHTYRRLASGTLNSLGTNEFAFNSTRLQKIKIQIHNHDNQPLNIHRFQVKGYEHELVARFSDPATYYLVYGSENPTTPNYDIGRFVKNIPDTLSTLQLKEETTIVKKLSATREPLFKNKIWLWLVMGVIIVLLAWFAIKMMKNA